MDKIDFDERTKASVTKLAHTISELQMRIQLICQIVINMKGEDPNEQYILAPDFSGLIKTRQNSDAEKDS